jgi:hypothetical protein
MHGAIAERFGNLLPTPCLHFLGRVLEKQLFQALLFVNAPGFVEGFRLIFVITVAIKNRTLEMN